MLLEEIETDKRLKTQQDQEEGRKMFEEKRRRIKTHRDEQTSEQKTRQAQQKAKDKKDKEIRDRIEIIRNLDITNLEQDNISFVREQLQNLMALHKRDSESPDNVRNQHHLVLLLFFTPRNNHYHLDRIWNHGNLTASFNLLSHEKYSNNAGIKSKAWRMRPIY